MKASDTTLWEFEPKTYKHFYDDHSPFKFREKE